MIAEMRISTRRMAAFGISLFVLTIAGPIPAHAADKPAATTEPIERISITVDISEAPQLAGFAKKVQAAADEWYPKIAALLPSDGYAPPRKITIVFRNDFNGVAECANDRIKASVKYFTAHPNDTGAFVHELVHAVQHYTHGDHPGWIVEGIADYVRFYHYEPAKSRPHPDPTKAKYSDSYRTTAAFLDWAQTMYDPKLIEKLNAACREARYTEAFWHDLTGKTLVELNDEWKASLVAKRG